MLAAGNGCSRSLGVPASKTLRYQLRPVRKQLEPHPADAGPVYLLSIMVSEATFAGASSPAGSPALFETVPQQGCVWRSWRISSMERTVAKVVPLFRQMTSMRAVESLTSHQPQRRSSMMPSRLIAAAVLLSPLLPARSIDARKLGTVQANGEGGFLTGVSPSLTCL